VSLVGELLERVECTSPAAIRAVTNPSQSAERLRTTAGPECSASTALQARRQGAARLVLSTITDWAREQGAPQLYLQVDYSNVAAMRLYEATGFTGIGTYHYRTRSGLP
jgi:GNAT superfamily N-acetyltransferase